MFSRFSFIYVCLFFLSCGTGVSEESDVSEVVEDILEEEEVTNEGDQNIEDFHSVLKPEKTDWNEDDIFTDTLELIGVNLDYDYDFATFRTASGEEVSFYGVADVDEYYQNRNFEIKWKPGRYYEAGEGEALYFKETITEFKVLETSNSLEAFLSRFSEAYQSNGATAVTGFTHPEVELLTAFNPGAYCALSGRDIVDQMDFPQGNLTISAGFPQGDFCESYSGIKNGLYYEFIDETELPAYDDMEAGGQVGGVTLYIEPSVEYWYFAKVLVVSDEYFNRYLYFFNGGGKWHFWVEDLCDCSA